MTQRIFDIENEKDMADLWDILPDMVKAIEKDDIGSLETTIPYNRYMGNGYCIGGCPYIAFNWHDKTEITRPIQEATEADIGKLCKFWDSNPDCYSFGIMTKISYSENAYYKDGWTLHKHCRRLTKTEVSELC